MQAKQEEQKEQQVLVHLREDVELELAEDGVLLLQNSFRINSFFASVHEYAHPPRDIFIEASLQLSGLLVQDDVQSLF